MFAAQLPNRKSFCNYGKSSKVCVIFIPKLFGLTGKEEIEQITFYWPLLLLRSADNTKITVLNRASFQKYKNFSH